jgi:pyrroline-5-carboxylate reductase
MNILIIGGGNMGLTYAQSFLRAHITTRDQLMILERSAERADELKTKHKDICKTFIHPEDCVAKADLIVLAVKPQDTTSLFEKLKVYTNKSQVFLSIMAGVKISAICKSLNISKVIRAMPNLPAQIGQGMTVFTSTDEVTRLELVTVQNLLNTTGKTIYVEKESLIDASTAISGSGPAYVYFFMDAMMQAARQMGFSAAESELLVGQTFIGALDLYQKYDDSCADWIQRVASKGGTTEAALKSFRKNELHQDIIDGANAALHRAIELGK